jgi:hypothetical protein
MRKAVHIALIVVFTFAVAGMALAEDKTPPPQQPSPEQMQEMMKQYMEMIAPGPQHQAMAKSVGDWTMKMKMWQTADAPPMEATGTNKVIMDYDGRFMIENAEAMMMGMPYKSRTTIGYDKFRKEYQMTYYDNMGTGMYTAKGQSDADGKVITMNGTMDDVMSNRKDMPMRYVTTITDDNHHTFQMYGPGPDGKEFKMMEITYERATK